jgi:hypothetical protein
MTVTKRLRKMASPIGIAVIAAALAASAVMAVAATNKRTQGTRATLEARARAAALTSFAITTQPREVADTPPDSATTSMRRDPAFRDVQWDAMRRATSAEGVSVYVTSAGDRICMLVLDPVDGSSLVCGDPVDAMHGKLILRSGYDDGDIVTGLMPDDVDRVGFEGSSTGTVPVDGNAYVIRTNRSPLRIDWSDSDGPHERTVPPIG